jgi:hypothetical protein
MPNPNIDPTTLSDAQLMQSLKDRTRSAETLKRKYEGFDDEVIKRLADVEKQSDEIKRLKGICRRMSALETDYAEDMERLARKKEELIEGIQKIEEETKLRERTKTEQMKEIIQVRHIIH